MSYSAEISRSSPTCLVFLLDQSSSMEMPIGDGHSNQRKCDVVADALNRVLAEFAIRCAKEEGVRDYFSISVIGYGTGVGPALGGELAGRELVPLSRVAAAPARVEERSKKISDGAGGLIEQTVKFPVWVEPVAGGGTPMCQALTTAARIVGDWLTEHPACFPPIVLNLSDGDATDGNPDGPAEILRSHSSTDGPVLLFNLHVSSDRRSETTSFPDTEDRLPSPSARRLFGMSSPVPDHMRAYIGEMGFAVSDGTRGFVYNADVVSVVQFLDIGTRPDYHG